MILIFEQDKRPREGKKWTWRPMIFRGSWKNKKTWRVGWGLWTLSYYPESGLRDFFEYIKGNNVNWQKRKTNVQRSNKKRA